MRKRLVDSYTDPVTGIRYGLRGDPQDFSLSQQYTHDHINTVTRELLMKNSPAAMVAGFAGTLAGGLSLSIAAGQAFDAAGLCYETITDPAGQPTVVTLSAADATNPRIDLIYILLEPSLQALPVARTFRRLRTPAELAAGVAPYTPEPFTRFTEEHTKASVLVRQGTPAAVPAAPALNANEVALYEVRVNANAATLVGGNVTDRRTLVRSLRDAWAQIDTLSANPAIANFNEAVDDRVAALIVDGAYLTEVYDDASNFLNYDVDLTALYTPLDVRYALNATLAEMIDDRVNALVAITAQSGLVRVYDDTLNVWTLAGVAASGAAMGMQSAAHYSLVSGATDLATGSTLAKRDVNGDASFRRFTSTIATGTSPLVVSSTTQVDNLNAERVGGQTLANLDTRFVNSTGNDTMAGTLTISLVSGASPQTYVARLSQNTTTGSGTSSNAVLQFDSNNGVNGRQWNIGCGVLAFSNVDNFGIRDATGSATRLVITPDPANTSVLYGNWQVTGSLSKASGTFLIDSLLDPANRNLRYGFIEGPIYDLLHRGKVQLKNGRAEINLDDYFKMTRGQFEALTQNVQGFAWNESGWTQVRVERIEGATVTIIAQDAACNDVVGFMVCGERNDPFIRASGTTDENGHMIVEFDKPEPTPEQLASLNSETVIQVVASEELVREDQVKEEVVVELQGLKGYPQYPEVHEFELPTREVTTKTVVASVTEQDALEKPAEAEEK